MSLNVRGLRAKRVRANEAALAQIETRLQRLQQEQVAANALLAEAKRAADDLERETRVLRDIKDNMAAELEASRAELVQECVSNLPGDILRCIFAEVVHDGEAHAPFAIAAVCARWRRVALDFSAMWSTIHIRRGPFRDLDQLRRVMAAEYHRVQMLLSRSRSVPLNILIPRIAEDGDAQLLRFIKRLFDAMVVHVSRWRKALLGLPQGAGPTLLDFLKGPTPLLVELQISGLSDGHAPSSSPSGYLPFAPCLEVLVIGHSGMGCSTGHEFPALKQLTFYPGACTETQVYEYLRMSSRSLQRLILCDWIVNGPSAMIHLPNLTYLCIAPTSVALLLQSMPALRTPVLEHLDLCLSLEDSVSDAILPYLDAVSRTVRRLTLAEPLTAHLLLLLARLGNIAELNFRPKLPAFIRDDALELLASSQPPIWPRLARVKDLAFRMDGDADNGWSTDKFLEFVASRNLAMPRANDADAARPCKLQEVTFGEDTPRWLVAEVQRLLAL